ncbi:TlpA family protein disulfide reductase [Micromonospora sp. LOL_025]|uniref:TlpA family protein disulfide reductase n=1 Tax=Micromonospora sp. LOL_025 TaxID=3345413 RepID=UPI003A8BA721
MHRRTVIIGTMAMLATTAVGCGQAVDRGDATLPRVEFPVQERLPGPELVGTLLDGSRFDWAPLRGNVVVANFWASWCAPCRAETDDLEAVYRATREAGVAFLGINTRDGKDAASAFAQGRVTYPSLFDPPGRVALQFRDLPPNTIPATVILDRKGRIAVVIRRAVVQSELEQVVAQLATERN